LTNVGPSWRSVSRAYVAAAVFSAGHFFRALRTLNAHPARERHTSTFRRMLDDLPRRSQPSSRASPSVGSSTGYGQSTSRTAVRIAG